MLSASNTGDAVSSYLRCLLQLLLQAFFALFCVFQNHLGKTNSKSVQSCSSFLHEAGVYKKSLAFFAEQKQN